MNLNLQGILGAILLALMTMIGIHSANVTVQPIGPPDKKAEPEPQKRRPLLPLRPAKEVAAQQLYQPVGHWDESRLKFVTTSFTPFAGVAKVGGTVSPDGAEEIACDLPAEFHLRNRGGSDGSGLCVFCSIQHASVWQHQWPTQHIFEWMQRYPGGGWPEKVDQKIREICKEKGVPVPGYLQVQNRDIEILKLACRCGRMPGITYNFSPTGRYPGRIAHMVSLVHCSDKWCAVLDNNYPGTIEWMDPQTFLRVYTNGGNGWAFIFLDPGPPAPPRNTTG